MVRKSLLTVILLAAMSIGLLAGSITGKVTDASSGEALIGANVVVEGTSLGGATDINGDYAIDNVDDGSYTVIVSYIGYTEGIFTVRVSGGSGSLNASLQPSGIGLNAVTISASRRPEKTLEAPASVSVLDAREVSTNSGLSSVDALRNVPGVDVSTTGVDRRELVLRGFNNAFSGATYVLTDYRQAAVPALAVNIHSIMPNIAIDVEKVEVVRGPGSALYGPGVDAGVIHYITKNPFDHPGSTVSVGFGERDAFVYAFRNAGKISESLGYKVTGQYGEADDWALDPNDPDDAVQLAGDVRPRVNDFEKKNFNGMLQWRPTSNVTLTANAGYSELKATTLTGIGTTQADGFGYGYGQFRLQAGGLFAQVYYNKNDAGESFVYGTGNLVVDRGEQVNVQSQYDFSLSDNQQFIIGADVDMLTPKTDATIYGRNEDNDDITEYGGYIQSLTRLSPKLDLTVALRGDYDNIIEEISLSPRVGLVFKPTGTSALRATYNRAFALPGSNSLFLDIVAGQAGPITVRGLGAKDGHVWERDASFAALAGTDLVARSLNPAAAGAKQPVGLTLDAVYGSVYAGLAAIPADNLAALLSAQLGLPIDAATAGALVGLLAPGTTNVTGFTQGQMVIPNLSGGPGKVVTDLTDVAPLEHVVSQTFEVGYKGLLGDKLLIAVDGYYSQKENFTGPLILETPLVYVPSLAGDLTGALAAGITGNATLAGTLQLLGVSPEQAAALIVGLAAGELPDASTPVAAVVSGSNAPGAGALPEMMLTYRNFGKVSYWGIDASLQYFADENVSFFSNVSFVSDDFFDNEELEESNTALSLALNAPTFKIKSGININIPRGANASAAVRYVKDFPVLSGPYVGGIPEPFGTGRGGVDDYVLYDFSIGYDFAQYAEGLRVDLIAQNALDNRHREFVGAPQVGRVGMVRLTYTR